jgi:hypothetical protein
MEWRKSQAVWVCGRPARILAADAEWVTFRWDPPVTAIEKAEPVDRVRRYTSSGLPNPRIELRLTR